MTPSGLSMLPYVFERMAPLLGAGKACDLCPAYMAFVYLIGDGETLTFFSN
jgi:hypothetical protein